MRNRLTKTTEVHLALSQRLNAAVSEAIQARSQFPLTYVANHLLAENADAELTGVHGAH